MRHSPMRWTCSSCTAGRRGEGSAEEQKSRLVDEQRSGGAKEQRAEELDGRAGGGGAKRVFIQTNQQRSHADEGDGKGDLVKTRSEFYEMSIYLSKHAADPWENVQNKRCGTIFSWDMKHSLCRT